MSIGTSIEWTDATWNPLRARDRKTGKVGHYCELISPGCAHCYASAFQPRFGLPMYKGPGQREERLRDVELLLDEKVLKQPLHWKKPRRVFVCSMTDFFLDAYPDDFLNDVFRVMWKSPQHTFQILTKRPERMASYCGTRWGHFDGTDYPPAPNVWLGVSVEDQQRADERIPLLLSTPAAVRFLSVEPLLGPLDLRPKSPDTYAILGKFYATGRFDPSGMSPATDRVLNCFPKLDWVILGGESGPGARPLHLSWWRSLVRQCAAAGVPCFSKQAGAHLLDDTGADVWPAGVRVHAGATADAPRLVQFRDPKGGDPAEWVEDLRVRQFPEVPHSG